MKRLLLLSSLRLLINNGLPPVLGKPFNQFRAVHVITASKGVTDISYLERNRKFFQDNHWDIEELDLVGKHESELRNILKNKELVYVEGGNSFSLLKSIRESGFETIIKELLPRGLIYMGASAGSYVACPTIEMTMWKHQDKFDHCGVTDLTAMNLVSFLLTAHYKSEYREMLKDKISKASYPVKILTDEQAFFVQDERVELVGSGPEIVL